jgi:UV excision repair protein RAD23
MLEPILQQIGAGNPQIAQLIGQNEEQFLQLLSEDDGAVPPGTTQIHVTEEERDAIERVRDSVCVSCSDFPTNSILVVPSRL